MIVASVVIIFDNDFKWYDAYRYETWWYVIWKYCEINKYLSLFFGNETFELK